MNFIERASVFCALAFWYLTVRSILLRFMIAELNDGKPVDKIAHFFASLIALPASALSIMLGAGLFFSIRWVFTGAPFL